MHLVWYCDESLPTSQEKQTIAQKLSAAVYALSANAVYGYHGSPGCERVLLSGYASPNESQINEGAARLEKVPKPQEYESIS
jgi:DNA-binding transcriptional MocR family regulator